MTGHGTQTGTRIEADEKTRQNQGGIEIVPLEGERGEKNTVRLAESRLLVSRAHDLLSSEQEA